MIDLDKLENRIKVWLTNHNINSRVDVESNMLGTNIHFQYFGEKLSYGVINDFERTFQVKKEVEDINILDYKTYDTVTGEYVTINNCNYTFSN